VATATQEKPDAVSRVAKGTMSKAEKERLQKSSEGLSGPRQGKSSGDAKARREQEKAALKAANKKRDLMPLAEKILRKSEGPVHARDFIGQEGITQQEADRLYLQMKDSKLFVKTSSKATFDLAELNPKAEEYRPGQKRPEPAAKATKVAKAPKAKGGKGKTTTPVKQRETAKQAAQKTTA
jgi:hypothetical protein